MAARPLRIGIFGAYGTRNLGNEATLAAIIQGLRRVRPDAEFRAFVLAPTMVEAREQIKCFPLFPGDADEPTDNAVARADAEGSVLTGFTRLRRIVRRIPGARAGVRLTRHALLTVGELAFLVKSRRRLAGLDLLLTGGLGTISDSYGGAWYHPWNTFRWVTLARSLGIPVAFASVGTGKLQSTWATRLARAAIARASHVSARDRRSQDALAALAPSLRPKFCPDLVLGFDADIGPAPRHELRTVGIVPAPHRDERYYGTGDRAEYSRYVVRMAAFVVRLISGGYRVAFIPTQTRADPLVIDDIRAAINGMSPGSLRRAELVCPIKTLPDADRAFVAMDFVISSRLHGTVLPLRLGVPAVAVFEEVKTHDLMDALGLGEFVLDARTFEPEVLYSVFSRLVANASAVRNRIRSGISQAQGQINLQYRELVELAEVRARQTG